MEKQRIRTAIGVSLELIGGSILGLAPSNYHTLAILMLISGSCLLVFSAYEWVTKNSNISFYYCGISFPLKRLIPLNVACLKVYEKMRTDHQGRIIEMLAPSEYSGDLRFIHIAELMINNSSLYGTHPPSTIVEIIDPKKMGYLSDDCKLTRNNKGNILYSDLKIEYSKFTSYIDSL